MQRIITLAILLTTLAANARIINEAEASRIAEEFLRGQGSNKSLSAIQVKNTQLSRSAAYNSRLHIFNLSDGGFIVIAGDDRARQVLAYSHENNLNLEKMPQPCIEWLNQYATEIEMLDSYAYLSLSEEESYIYPKNVVEPLITTLWNQREPFNNNCPIDGSTGQRCLTGCVATATAQIMNYHRYPARATGTVTYEDHAQNETRTIDLSSYGDIDWANMSMIPLNEREKKAVADLMIQTGYAVKMQYSSSVSIAIHRNAATALIENFGYDANIHRYERDYMTEKDWVETLVGELSAKRPVLYDGRSAESGGHAFVCDGYDGNGLFHFNWGWGGLSDGYFALSALTPGNNAYTGNQAMECHIMPSGAEGSVPQTDHLLGIDCLHVFTSATAVYDPEDTYEGTKDSSGFIFYCWNFGHKPFEGEICATIMKDGAITAIATGASGIAAGSYKIQTFYMPSSLADGSYTTRFHYRLPGEDRWHLILAKNGTPYEAAMKVAGDNITYGKGALSSIIEITDSSPIDISTSTENISIACRGGIEQIILTNINGRCIISRDNCGDSANIDISGISRGAYIIRVIGKDNNQAVRKIIL